MGNRYELLTPEIARERLPKALREQDWQRVMDYINIDPNLVNWSDGNGFQPLHYTVAPIREGKIYLSITPEMGTLTQIKQTVDFLKSKRGNQGATARLDGIIYEFNQGTSRERRIESERVYDSIRPWELAAACGKAWLSRYMNKPYMGGAEERRILELEAEFQKDKELVEAIFREEWKRLKEEQDNSNTGYTTWGNSSRSSGYSDLPPQSGSWLKKGYEE